MALGPAMVMGTLGIIALLSMSKKSGASPGAPALPSGEPASGPSGGSSGGSGGRVNTKPIGPLPVQIPEALAELVAKSLKDLTVNDDGTVSGPVTAEAVQRATSVASQVERAGFPDAARAFRAYIQLAASKVPSPPPDKAIQLPGIPQATIDQINRTIRLERDPAKLQKVLDAVKAMPQSKERDLLIEMLAEAIRQTTAAMVLAETLKKTEEVLNSPGLPPVSTTPTPTVTLPEVVVTAPSPSAPVDLPISDTVESRRAINTANHLRNKVADMGGDVKKAKGKEDKSMVIAFQKGEGLTADGKAGPGTVLKMAKYTGDLPPVYYWPVSATAKNVNEFRATLQQMADVHEQAGRRSIAAKLRASAARERGQSGIVGQMPA